MKPRDDSERIVITGVGLAAPNGNNLEEYRRALLNGVSGVVPYEIRYFGKTVAGVCNCEITKYRPRREIRRGTRAGSLSVYCVGEAIADSGLLFILVSSPQSTNRREQPCGRGYA